MNKFPHEGSCEGLISERATICDLFASRLRVSIMNRQNGNAGINLIFKKGSLSSLGCGLET